MKKAILLLILFVGCISIPLNAGEPTAFPMVCRGGGDMAFGVYTRFVPSKSRLDENRVRIEIMFKKSGYPGKDRKPAPGECAWMDRTIGNDEPGKLVFEARGGISSIYKSPKETKIFVNQDTITKLIEYISKGQVFYVYCYRELDYFKIKSLGLQEPSK